MKKLLLVLGIGIAIGVAVGFLFASRGAGSKRVVHRADFSVPLKDKGAERKESDEPFWEEYTLRGGFLSLEEAEGYLSTLPIDYTTEHFSVNGQEWFAVAYRLWKTSGRLDGSGGLDPHTWCVYKKRHNGNGWGVASNK